MSMASSQPAFKGFTIRPVAEEDRSWVIQVTSEQWGSDRLIVHGDIFNNSQMPGFCAETDGERTGLLTYHITGRVCEIISLVSLRSGMGIGSGLIEVARDTAALSGCRKLRVITTNDNIEALLFYQKRGFVLFALRPGAVIEARKIKPQIALFGNHGLPIRDEIELEMDLPG